MLSIFGDDEQFYSSLLTLLVCIISNGATLHWTSENKGTSGFQPNDYVIRKMNLFQTANKSLNRCVIASQVIFYATTSASQADDLTAPV